MFGDVEAIDVLLALGADVHGRDEEGITPLHRAVQSGAPLAVERLLRSGADPNLRDRRWRGTALGWALALGRPQLFERLVPISRDVRALTKMPAFERLKAVLDLEPSLANDRIAEDAAPTPLYCLPDNEDQAAEAARILMAYGADPSVVAANGRTPVDAARARGLDEAAELMEARRNAH
jgi:ankyrin repeat protein